MRFSGNEAPSRDASHPIRLYPPQSISSIPLVAALCADWCLARGGFTHPPTTSSPTSTPAALQPFRGVLDRIDFYATLQLSTSSLSQLLRTKPILALLMKNITSALQVTQQLINRMKTKSVLDIRLYISISRCYVYLNLYVLNTFIRVDQKPNF